MFTITLNTLKDDVSYIPKTTLERLVLSNKDINWNFVKLVKNPNITKGFILNYFDPDIYLPYLLLNPNIKLLDFSYTCTELVEKCFGKTLYLVLIPDITEKVLSEINKDDYESLIEEIINLTGNYGDSINQKINIRWSPEKNSQVIKIISKHPRTSLNLINKYIVFLDMSSISLNPNLNKTFIEKYRTNLDWFHLSKNSSLSLDILTQFQEIDKYIFSLINNDNFNDDWVKFVFSKINSKEWIYNNIRYQISKHKNISMDFIDNNLELPWCWMGISNNPNLTMKFIVKNLDKPFCPKSLSKNKCITIKDYQRYRHHDKLWDHEYLMSNPNIDEQIVLYLDNVKKYNLVCNNVSLDINLVVRYKDKPWDYRSILSKHVLNLEQLSCLIERTNIRGDNWFSVSKNLKACLDKVIDDDYKHYPWNWDGLCINPNITHNLVNKFKNKLDRGKYDLLCQNKFSLERNYYGPLEYNDQNQTKSIEVVNQIKEELMMKTWNPSRMTDWCLDLDEKSELS